MVDIQIVGFIKAPKQTLVSVGVQLTPFSEFMIYKNTSLIHDSEDNGSVYRFIFDHDSLLKLVISKKDRQVDFEMKVQVGEREPELFAGQASNDQNLILPIKAEEEAG